MDLVHLAVRLAVASHAKALAPFSQMACTRIQFFERSVTRSAIFGLSHLDRAKE
jgi:hypothetical protein